MYLPLPYCGTLSVSLTAASSPKGRAKEVLPYLPAKLQFTCLLMKTDHLNPD